MRIPKPGRDIFPVLLPILSFALMLIYAREVTSAVGEALSLCAKTVIPSLFPYFVLSGIAVRTKLIPRLAEVCAPFMRRAFGVGGAGSAAIIIGLIAGYPVGAKTAIELHARGALGRDDTERLLAFCSNSGPGFIVGFVGAGLFGSVRTGLMLYGIHALSALVTGLILSDSRSGKSDTAASFTSCSGAEAFTEAVAGAVSSILSVCAYVIVFSLIVELAEATLIPASLLMPLRAVLEMTSALSYTAACVTDKELMFVIVSAILAWGGVSVHCQTASLAARTGIRLKRYCLGKALHALLATACAAGLMLLLSPEALAAAAVEYSYSLTHYHRLLGSLTGASLLWILLISLVQWAETKRKKRL